MSSSIWDPDIRPNPVKKDSIHQYILGSCIAPLVQRNHQHKKGDEPGRYHHINQAIPAFPTLNIHSPFYPQPFPFSSLLIDPSYFPRDGLYAYRGDRQRCGSTRQDTAHLGIHAVEGDLMKQRSDWVCSKLDLIYGMRDEFRETSGFPQFEDEDDRRTV